MTGTLRSQLLRLIIHLPVHLQRIPGLPAGAFLRDWQIGGITQFCSGFPLEILGGTPRNQNFEEDRADLVGPYRRLNPREVHTFDIGGRTVTGNFLFDPTAFKDSRSGPGSLGRNVFSAPGINLTSLSLSRRIRIRDSHEAELRADITNLFNHANFQDQVEFVRDSDFGQNFFTLPARRIQLSLRYRF